MRAGDATAKRAAAPAGSLPNTCPPLLVLPEEDFSLTIACVLHLLVVCALQRPSPSLHMPWVCAWSGCPEPLLLQTLVVNVNMHHMCICISVHVAPREPRFPHPTPEALHAQARRTLERIAFRQQTCTKAVMHESELRRTCGTIPFNSCPIKTPFRGTTFRPLGLVDRVPRHAQRRLVACGSTPKCVHCGAA